MAHRGRLNVLANIVGKRYDQIFKEFEGDIDPDSTQGSGDVKYHLGAVGQVRRPVGKEMPVELSANPSHLEAVDPVVVGMARAKQDLIDDPEAFSRAAARHPRRRRVRRPGCGRRDAQPVEDQGLPRRWHGPPRHQQPARVHDTARGGALVGVRDRRGEDGAGADLPRQRRRPRSVRARRAPGVRLPPGVSQRRRHRHDLLPAPRSQRGRRPQLHAAASCTSASRAGAPCASSTPRRW